MEKWGYQISYKKALDGKHKAIRQLYGDFSQSYTELPRLFLGIKQANPGCAVVWKTCETNMPNTEIFQRVFWSFKPSIEGFQHCRPVMSIDGTHLYGKYKGKLLIAMGVMEIISFFHWHLLLQKARILIVGDGSWHALEMKLHKGREFALYQTDIQESW